MDFIKKVIFDMMQSVLIKFSKLISAGALCATLSACEFGDIAQIDFVNAIVNLTCGQYAYDGQNVDERCGTTWGAYGYIYEKDQVAFFILSTDQATDDYIATSRFWFDSRYMVPGQVVTKEMSHGLCNRRKPEAGDPTYYSGSIATFRFEVLEKIREKTYKDRVTDTEWKVKWELKCANLDFEAKGEDHVLLDHSPPFFGQWKRSGLPFPPEFDDAKLIKSENADS